MYCITCFWSDLEQAKEFAQDVSKQYPGLKLFLDLSIELDNIRDKDEKDDRQGK